MLNNRNHVFVLRQVAVAALAMGLSCVIPISTRGEPGSGSDAVALIDSKAPIAPEPPSLLVVISVDQFSADLFSEYRSHFTGGLRRMQSAVVFPLAYQAHATTETCPGHSTILTGAHPARTGIISNDWIAPKLNREDKTVYCVEDETALGSSSRQYKVSHRHLLVPTLGERMKAINPRTRVVSIAGKDRAAVLLAGHQAEEVWWWDGKKFASYDVQQSGNAVEKANMSAAGSVAKASAAMDLPEMCISRSRKVDLQNDRQTGQGRFARQAGDYSAFRNSPALDRAVLDLAADLAADLLLGSRPSPDILTIGLSATDFVGHVHGTAGSEMCINLLALDQALGLFFERLDATAVDYQVVLTADHGGLDFPERSSAQGAPDAARIGPALSAEAIGSAVASEMGLSSPVLYGGKFADIWVSPQLNTTQRAKVKRLAIAKFHADPSVHSVFTREQILAQNMPTSAPDNWTLLERVRASFNAERSGDFYVVLKSQRTPIADHTGSYLAMHGSPWDYDRRVPILFWRKGMEAFEQPLAVATVDIVPTLASLINLKIPNQEIDGRCLDLVPGTRSNCIN